jgi:quinol-cytochrome oxidoreductase complex cytochrome b subunit
MRNQLETSINDGRALGNYRMPALRLWITSLFLLLITIAAAFGQ